MQPPSTCGAFSRTPTAATLSSTTSTSGEAGGAAEVAGAGRVESAGELGRDGDARGLGIGHGHSLSSLDCWVKWGIGRRSRGQPPSGSPRAWPGPPPCLPWPLPGPPAPWRLPPRLLCPQASPSASSAEPQHLAGSQHVHHIRRPARGAGGGRYVAVGGRPLRPAAATAESARLDAVLPAADEDGLAGDQGLGDLGPPGLEYSTHGLARHAHGGSGLLVTEALEVDEADGLELVDARAGAAPDRARARPPA